MLFLVTHITPVSDNKKRKCNHLNYAIILVKHLVLCMNYKEITVPTKVNVSKKHQKMMSSFFDNFDNYIYFEPTTNREVKLFVNSLDVQKFKQTAIEFKNKEPNKDAVELLDLFVERLARSLVQIAWNELGGNATDIRVEKGSVTVPLKTSYLERMQDKHIKKHIQNNLIF